MRGTGRIQAPVAGARPVKDLFKRRFGYPPVHVLAVPGSVELLGAYADAHDGLALTAAVNRYLWLAISPRTDGRVEWASSAFADPARLWLSELAPDPTRPRWTDPACAVLELLRKRGAHFTGFNAVVESELPLDVGLGGSMALAIATAFAVRQLWPYRLTELGLTVPPRKDERGRLEPMPSRERMHLARLLVEARRATGRPGRGLTAALPMLFGRAAHLVTVDCRFGSTDLVPFVGEAIAIGVPRPLTIPDDASIAAVCNAGARAAQKMQAGSLRSVEPTRLRELRTRLSAFEWGAASHAIGEIRRAAFGERAAREDDHGQIGQYLNQSHESAREFLRNNTEDLEALVRLAKAHPACLGARTMGPGFGGAAVCLVRHHEADRFVDLVSHCYEKLRGTRVEFLVTVPTDAA